MTTTEKQDLTIKNFLSLNLEAQEIIFLEIVAHSRLAFLDGDSVSVCIQKAKKATGYQKTVVNFCVRADKGFVKAANERAQLNRKFAPAAEIRISEAT